MVTVTKAMSDVVERVWESLSYRCSASAKQNPPIIPKVIIQFRPDDLAFAISALKPGDVLPNGLTVVEAQPQPQPRPDANRWIPWHGGENPVPGKMVECKLHIADGATMVASDDLIWSYSGGIIAYRVIEP